MWSFIRSNSLTIVFFSIFLLCLLGQSLAGHSVHNEDQNEHGSPSTSYAAYIRSGHFVEATFENWESEFLQMAAFVILTAFLYQKGSSQSRRPGEVERVDLIPADSRYRPDSPWPVHRGGLVLRVYEHSLSLALFALFLLSLALHARGGVEEYNREQMLHGSPGISVLQYVTTSRFWFESFQNWQSEFLSVGVIIVLSIFLRERGSPESKAVDEPHSETAGA
jgi:hypothetical protein